MARTRKGNDGIRIKEVSYSFTEHPVINLKAECQKHYRKLKNKNGFWVVSIINDKIDFYEYK